MTLRTYTCNIFLFCIEPYWNNRIVLARQPCITVQKIKIQHVLTRFWLVTGKNSFEVKSSNALLCRESKYNMC